MARGAKGICMRCGFEYLLRELRKEWTGAVVCDDCWDKRPEVLKAPKLEPEGLPKKNATGEPDDVFIETNDHTREDL